MPQDKADIATRLRQTRADMLGTEDEEHYWDCHDAADEIDRLRLTDAEREAVEWALKEAVWSYNPDCGEHPATLRGLLERLGGER